jgi:hypothetical protein
MGVVRKNGDFTDNQQGQSTTTINNDNQQRQSTRTINKDMRA